MTMLTLTEARPLLAALTIAVLAVLTLRHLRLRGVRRRNGSRDRVRSLLLALAMLFSAGLITGSAGVGEAVRAGARTAVALNVGAIDETVTSIAPAGAARSFPGTTADLLRGGLTAGDGVAGVTGAMVQLVEVPDRATHRTIRGALLGVPITYPPALGPLTAVQGSAVTLGQLGADEVYINQTAAQALGARAGDQLRFLAGGHAVATGPTTLYFAAGDTGAHGGPQATVEEALVLQNPTPFPATVLLTYLIQEAPSREITRLIPPHATLRESVNGDIGPNHRVAVIISSPVSLTAQRLLRRLDAHGVAIDTTSTPGIATPGTSLTFAPAAGGGAKKAEVALANPGTAPAQVSATVSAPAGTTEGTTTQSVTVPGRARTTLRLDHPAGYLRVTSDRPIVAEQIYYSGAGDGSGGSGWSLVTGVPVASHAGRANPLTVAVLPAASVYAPLVRAVLRNQNLAAGGLLTGGTEAAPIVLLPLPRLQQDFDQSGRLTAVLIANRDDTPAGAPLTDQVTSAVQALLANGAAAMTIKQQLILPRGQDALQALQQDPQLADSTRAKLGDVQAELAVPGSSTRLKSLLADPAVSAALRTISDPALADSLAPALSRLSHYVVHPFKREGLEHAEQVGGAAARRARAWGWRALVAGILLSALLVWLLPTAGRARAGRRRGLRHLFSRSYASDLCAVLLGILLGSAVGVGVAPIAAALTPNGFALPVQIAASAGVSSGSAELVVARLDTPVRRSVLIGAPSIATPLPTSTPTATPLPTKTPTALPLSTSTPVLTGTSALSSTPPVSGTSALTTLPLTGTPTALSTSAGRATPTASTPVPAASTQPRRATATPASIATSMPSTVDTSTPAPAATSTPATGPTAGTAADTLPNPAQPPQLQAVAPSGAAPALAAGRWAVCYTYADGSGHESAASPRYILIVPTGADIRIAPIARPSGVASIGYYVSPAVNVVANLRRYGRGGGTDVIVTGPGTGPLAP